LALAYHCSNAVKKKQFLYNNNGVYTFSDAYHYTAYERFPLLLLPHACLMQHTSKTKQNRAALSTIKLVSTVEYASGRRDKSQEE